MIVLDVSRSMDWAGREGRLTKLEYAKRLVAALSLVLAGCDGDEASKEKKAARAHRDGIGSRAHGVLRRQHPFSALVGHRPVKLRGGPGRKEKCPGREDRGLSKR